MIRGFGPFCLGSYMILFNKEYDLDIRCFHTDDKRKKMLKNLGFSSYRKEKALEWDKCASFFIGKKSDYVQCIAQQSDVEKMLKLGFVANIERLSDVNSKEPSDPIFTDIES